MLSLASRQQVHLASSRRQRTRVLAADTKQNEFGHVPKIEADASAVRPAVLSDLMPDNIGLISEAPGLQNLEPLRQQRVWTPKIQVRSRSGQFAHRKCPNFG